MFYLFKVLKRYIMQHNATLRSPPPLNIITKKPKINPKKLNFKV